FYRRGRGPLAANRPMARRAVTGAADPRTDDRLRWDACTGTAHRRGAVWISGASGERAVVRGRDRGGCRVSIADDQSGNPARAVDGHRPGAAAGAWVGAARMR